MSWDVLGMGDFAVGKWVVEPPSDIGRRLQDDIGMADIRIVEGNDVGKVLGEEVNWVGYVGVRDANLSMLVQVSGGAPLPLGLPWQEMVELRYGYNPLDWGNGYGTEAARGLILWAEKVKGVRRFIAETEKANLGSGKILKKLGFKERVGNEYWQEESQIEWEKIVRA